MTPAEIRSYNAGILAVLDVANAAVEAFQAAPWKPTRAGAVSALAALAGAGRALLIDDDGAPCQPAPSGGPSLAK